MASYAVNWGSNPTNRGYFTSLTTGFWAHIVENNLPSSWWYWRLPEITGLISFFRSPCCCRWCCCRGVRWLVNQLNSNNCIIQYVIYIYKFPLVFLLQSCKSHSTMVNVFLLFVEGGHVAYTITCCRCIYWVGTPIPSSHHQDDIACFQWLFLVPLKGGIGSI